MVLDLEVSQRLVVFAASRGEESRFEVADVEGVVANVALALEAGSLHPPHPVSNVTWALMAV